MNEETITLDIRGISKSFGASIAISSISSTLVAGYVYALVGENGSGKSTLIKVLGGVVVPDKGEVLLNGRTLRPFRPEISLRRGISVVYQELLLAPDLSVLDNLYMWDGRWFRSAQYSTQERRSAEAALASLASRPPDLDELVSNLDLGLQQVVAVCRALLRREQDRCFVFDESTSALDRDEAARLLRICRELAHENRIVVFVSHRMNEIAEVSDAAIVLRSGQVVGEVSGDQLTTESLLAMMSGEREASAAARRVPVPTRAQVLGGRGATPEGNPDGTGELAATKAADRFRFTLEASNIRLSIGDTSMDLKFTSGSIVGFAGLDGHGQSALLKVLVGMEGKHGVVRLVAAGAPPVAISNPWEAVDNGVVYIPRDRKREGLLLGQSVLDNFALPTWRNRYSTLGFIRRRSARRDYNRFSEQLQIRASSSAALVDSLSGGNQQKVILARWLAAAPRVVVLDDPTRGVDHGTKLDFYTLLRALASGGVLVMLVSTELAELVALCDRVLVLRNRKVSADLWAQTGAISESRILAAMFGELESGRPEEPVT